MRISDWSSDVCSSDLEKLSLSPEQMADYLAALVNDYPIRSIEDGMSEDEFAGWKAMTDLVGDTCQLVGDDLFRSEERRVGKEGVSTCRSRGSQDNEQQKNRKRRKSP